MAAAIEAEAKAAEAVAAARAALEAKLRQSSSPGKSTAATQAILKPSKLAPPEERIKSKLQVAAEHMRVETMLVLHENNQQPALQTQRSGGPNFLATSAGGSLMRAASLDPGSSKAGLQSAFAAAATLPIQRAPSQPTARLDFGSNPRRVSSSGYTGRQIIDTYRTASPEATGTGNGQYLRLDELLRAYNALSKHRSSADRTAALAALLARVSTPSVYTDEEGDYMIDAQGNRIAADFDQDFMMQIPFALYESFMAEGNTALNKSGFGAGKGLSTINTGDSTHSRLMHDPKVSGNSVHDRQAALISLLTTPAHNRDESFAATLAALATGVSVHDSSQAPNRRVMTGPAGVPADRDRDRDVSPGSLSPPNISRRSMQPQSGAAGGQQTAGGNSPGADSDGHVLVHTSGAGASQQAGGSKSGAVLKDTQTGQMLLSTARREVTVEQALAALRQGLMMASDTNNDDEPVTASCGCFGGRKAPKKAASGSTARFELDHINRIIVVPAAGRAGTGNPAPQRQTVTGVTLNSKPGSSCPAVTLQTATGSHDLDFSSQRDWAGVLLGLNAALVAAEAAGTSGGVKGQQLARDMHWSNNVQGITV